MCPNAGRTEATSLIPKGYYCRLFESTRSPLSSEDEEKLVRLGESMRYTVEREGTLTPRVGFTYFGQFVGHDLSHDTTPLAGLRNAEQIPNYRTPYLNLEQVYGGGPACSPHLYEGEKGGETFKIGCTSQGNYRRDLPIEAGELLIADTRNLDNLIVRQLHVVFLRFHNEAVKQLSARPQTVHGIENLGAGTIFERAQRLVRWHYQWIVRHDVLPRILHHSFWFNGNRIISDSNAIPIEFSLAAYRFGHSMVRPAYSLNCRKKRVEISDLMHLGQEPTPVADDFLIEWGRFFDGLPYSGPVASSAYIDTSLAAPLHKLSPSILKLCVKNETPESPASLPVRTLLRGARTWLPSGQEVATFLSKKAVLRHEFHLTAEQLIQNTCNDSGSVLREIQLQDNAPLFYYVLKEAEITAQSRTLGPVGSYIVGHVLLTALRSDPDGYLSKIGSHWSLPLWRFSSGSLGTVNSLINIIRLVGANHLLPECDTKWRSLIPIS